MVGGRIMHLDAHDFTRVWQHICARATVDQQQGALIPSFAGRGGNWVEAVQQERILVRARKPKGDGSPQPLAKSTFRQEWRQLTICGSSSNDVRQVIWDMFTRYFDDVERNADDRHTLFWTEFRIS
jgi:hypothetical protein